MVRKFHNHKLQTNPWHCEEEPHSNHEALGKQTKQSNQISLPHLLTLFLSFFLSLSLSLSLSVPLYSLPYSLCRSPLSILFVSIYSVSLYVSLYSVSLSTSVSTLLSLSTLSLSLYSLSLHFSLLYLYLILY